MTIPELPLSCSPPTIHGYAYSTGSFEKYRKNYPPLYIEYDTEYGYQNDRHIKLWELTAKREQLEGDQILRRGVGLKLPKEDQDTLESLPGLIQLLEIEIKKSSHEIDQLKAKCQEQGIIDLDNNYIDNACEDPEDTPNDITTALSTNTNSNSNINIDINIDNTLSFIANTPGTPADDTTQNHINSWLLVKLTASYTEIDLLNTILSIEGIEQNLATLQNVQSLWDRDGAGLAPPLRLGAMDGDMLRRFQWVTREIVDNGYDRALVKSLLGLSLWEGRTCKRGDDSEYLNDSDTDGDTEAEMIPGNLTQAIGLGKSLSWPHSQGLFPQRQALLPDSHRAVSCLGKRLYSSSGPTLPQSYNCPSLPRGAHMAEICMPINLTTQLQVPHCQLFEVCW